MNSFFEDPQSIFQWELKHRILGWVRIRLFFAILLFLLCFSFRPALPLPYPIVPILVLVLVLVGFNVFTRFFLAERQWTLRLSYLQVAMDVFVVTAIFQSTGGIDSPFNWFYILLIIAVGLIGGFKLTMLVTGLSIGLYALVLWGQYYFYLPHYHVGHLATHADVGFHNRELVLFNLLINTFAFLATGIIAGYVAETAEQRKKQIEAASKFYKEAILKSVTAAQEEERKRIARELHDETGQALTSLLLRLQAIEEDHSLPVNLKEKIHNLQMMTISVLQGLRMVISNLRPVMLDDLGLVPSIKWYLKNHVEPTGIKCTVVVYGSPRRLEEATEISVYRVIQEAVNNVVKHAAASELIIIFRFEARQVKIVVQDNGKGFSLASLPLANRWGIVGMRERVALLGGNFDLASSPADGTTLTIEIPC